MFGKNHIRIIVIAFTVILGQLAGETEIDSLRRFHSKTYEINPGLRRMEIWLQPVHYLDASGNFVDIPNDERRDSLIQIAELQYQKSHLDNNRDNYNPIYDIHVIYHNGANECGSPGDDPLLVAYQTLPDPDVDGFGDLRFYEVWTIDMSMFQPWYSVQEISHDIGISGYTYPPNPGYGTEEYTVFLRDYEYPTDAYNSCDYFYPCAVGEIFTQFTVDWDNYSPPTNPWSFTAPENHTITTRLQHAIPKP
jgi:hypothetical protein